MTEFVPHGYISVREAVDRLGRGLFPSEWPGEEHKARSGLISGEEWTIAQSAASAPHRTGDPSGSLSRARAWQHTQRDAGMGAAAATLGGWLPKNQRRGRSDNRFVIRVGKKTVHTDGATMAIHKLPGGNGVIYALGPDDYDYSWHSQFFGDDSYAKAQALDAIRVSGAVVAWVGIAGKSS
jgi:hypothetical protein